MYRVFVRKPQVKRPLGRPMYRREDNIKMDLKGIESGAWTVLMSQVGVSSALL
jgi:hypothetical protein